MVKPLPIPEPTAEEMATTVHCRPCQMEYGDTAKTSCDLCGNPTHPGPFRHRLCMARGCTEKAVQPWGGAKWSRLCRDHNAKRTEKGELLRLAARCKCGNNAPRDSSTCSRCRTMAEHKLIRDTALASLRTIAASIRDGATMPNPADLDEIAFALENF